MLSSDIFLEKIATSLREKAEKMLDIEYTPENLEELETQLRFWFSKKYSIPMYSQVLNDYQLKDMLFEYYLHTIKPKTKEEITLQKNEELGDMIAEAFGDDDLDFMDEVAEEMKQSASWEEKF
jgi:hypothetical protein